MSDLGNVQWEATDKTITGTFDVKNDTVKVTMYLDRIGIGNVFAKDFLRANGDFGTARSAFTAKNLLADTEYRAVLIEQNALGESHYKPYAPVRTNPFTPFTNYVPKINKRGALEPDFSAAIVNKPQKGF